ncbi:hypothetical protein ACI3PL_24355, partial [Lacticaseibacillus paracasei]
QDMLDEQTDSKEDGGWDLDALQTLIELADNATTDLDQDKDSLIARTRTPQSVKKGICLATRYEAGEDGEWVTFAPDHSCVEVRRIEN